SYLGQKGIMTKVYFNPVHLTKFYRRQLGCKRGLLPITEDISEQVLTLPMYPGLSKAEMDYIAGTVLRFFRR
ncbi:MAG: DegT/DnrJ/EryC1/StrS family aminotransferase, partial [Candidatus Omnitrophica bacterium]|nr:DegT/DnrJ/EryC1/StrS family aminotransferase [Candidatus Omnitrophota bacterium]